MACLLYFYVTYVVVEKVSQIDLKFAFNVRVFTDLVLKNLLTSPGFPLWIRERELHNLKCFYVNLESIA